MAERLGLGPEVRELKLGPTFTNNKSTAFHTLKCKFGFIFIFVYLRNSYIYYLSLFLYMLCDLSREKGPKAAKIDFRIFAFISSFQVVLSTGRIRKIITNLLCP